MKILMFWPGRIDYIPPLMTAAVCMAECGADVRVVASGCAKASAEYLRSHSVDLVLVSDQHPQALFLKVLLLIQAVIRFMREKWRMAPDCVWYIQSHPLIWYAFLPFMSWNSSIVLNSHELSSHIPFRWMTQKALARRADLVIIPEPNRAWILKKFSTSKAFFFVIPNRPLDDVVPIVRGEACTTSLFRERGGSLDCNRFLIYQGAFMPSRCLKEVIQGFKMLPFKDTGLILMGGDPYSRIYKDLSDFVGDDCRIVLLPRIPPPQHLLVTKGCIGGILLYRSGSLNSIYCAPNKIYEYAALGLGMILPDYPGLASINSEFGLGTLCDPENPYSIMQAMNDLLSEKPEEYQKSSKRFLDATIKPLEAYQRVYQKLEEIIRKRKG